MADFNILKTVFIQMNQKPAGWDNLTYGNPAVKNKDMVLGSSKLSKCGVDVEIVNLSKITDANILVGWLEDNSSIICYDDSYDFIEKVHIIDKKGADDNTITAAIQDPSHVRKASLTAADLTNKLGAKFQNHNYDKNAYIRLYFDTNDQFQYETAAFSSTDGKTYHSYPFFRSILVNNDVVTLADLQKCIFDFAEVTINLQTSAGQSPVLTVAFRVTFPNGISTTFYDYSQNPSPAIGLGPLFTSMKLII
ncbi:hypothetical protein G4D82_00725 [Flavobacterium sp. CYK-4]|uniref:hypothetical protein n=1 Tax=Flavobacterium lotistagni TaxID=2709660 RepID=UPI00140C5085|nr:hypothetical protein [Flavobacterium lotistagni]NHM05731.1 hypothetical protein [Flavobacterium lotistagni]